MFSFKKKFNIIFEVIKAFVGIYEGWNYNLVDYENKRIILWTVMKNFDKLFITGWRMFTFSKIV